MPKKPHTDKARRGQSNSVSHAGSKSSSRRYDIQDGDLSEEEMDVFHTSQTKISLDPSHDSHSSNMLDSEDDNADYLALNLPQSEDEDAEENSKLAETEEAEISTAWGKKKSIYYSTDNVDAAAMSDDELKEEEDEAMRLQKEKLAATSEADYFDDEIDDDSVGSLAMRDSLADAKSAKKVSASKPKPRDEDEALLEAMNHDLDMIPLDLQIDTNSPHNELEVETVAKNLTTMPRESQLEMLKAEAPELIPLIDDMKEKLHELQHRIVPALSALKGRKLATGNGHAYLELRHQLLWHYTLTTSFYLLLRADGRLGGAHHRSHPALKQIVDLRQVLDSLEEVDRRVQPQIDLLLDGSFSDHSAIDALCLELNDAVVELDDSVDDVHSESEQDFESNGAQVVDDQDDDPDDRLEEHSEELEDEQGANGVNEDNIDSESDANDKDDSIDPVEARLMELDAGRKHERNLLMSGTTDDTPTVVTSLKRQVQQRLLGHESNPVLARAQRRAAAAIVTKLANATAKRLSGDDSEDEEVFSDEQDDDELNEMMEESSSSGMNAMKIMMRAAEKTIGLNKKHATGSVASSTAANTVKPIKSRKAQCEAALDPEQAEHADAALEYYESLAADAKHKKERRASKAAGGSGRDLHLAGPDFQLLPEDSRRQAGSQILNNRGLTPYRKKDVRNPRLHMRNKYDRAMKKRSSTVREFKGKEDQYSGEKSGIKTHLARSTKL